MPRIGPIKREDLIRNLQYCGFEGPFSATKHQFMIKDNLRPYIPNPHHGEISKELLSRILKQAGIDHTIWSRLS